MRENDELVISTGRTTRRTGNDTLTPTTVRIYKDGTATLTKVSHATGAKFQGKVFLTKSKSSWYRWEDLDGNEQARLTRWLDQGGCESGKRAPRFSGKRQIKKSPKYQTQNQRRYKKRKFSERLRNLYLDHDQRSKFITLNMDGNSSTTSRKIAVNRGLRWLDQVNSFVEVEACDIVPEMNWWGEYHLHLLVTFKDGQRALQNGAALNQRLKNSWGFCDASRSKIKQITDKKGLLGYLFPTMDGQRLSDAGDYVPDPERLGDAISWERKAIRLVNNDLVTGKAKEAAEAKLKEAKMLKKQELSKQVKHDEEVIIFAKGDGRAKVVKATPEIIDYLKKYGRYAYTTVTEIRKVNRETGEVVGLVQIVERDVYQVDNVVATIKAMARLDAVTVFA